MREPSLTVSPPMIAGSILTLRSTALSPVIDLSALLSASRWLSDSFSATVTSALTSPFQCATSLRKSRIMSRTANSRRLAATNSRKFAASPPMPALSSTAASALRLLLGAEHRAAHQPVQVRAVGDHGVECFEIGLHRVDGLGVERELEQRARITARHAGYGRIFACHVQRALEVKSAGSAPAPAARRKPLDFKGIFRFRGPSPNPAKSRGCVTYRSLRCNTARAIAGTGPAEMAAFCGFSRPRPGRSRHDAGPRYEVRAASVTAPSGRP